MAERRPELFQSKVIKEIADESTWEKLVDDVPGPVMVEFFVTWCPHCQREAPILDETAPEIRKLGVEVYHANAEVMWQKGAVYNLEETPSFILIKDGKLIAEHEGFLTSDQLIEFAEGKINDRAQKPAMSSTNIVDILEELAAAGF